MASDLDVTKAIADAYASMYKQEETVVAEEAPEVEVEVDQPADLEESVELEEAYTKQQIMKIRQILGRDGQANKKVGIEKLMKHGNYSKELATTMWKAVTEGMDPVGKEDGDVDNDGDMDAADKYLKMRRKKISKAMKEEVCGECGKEPCECAVKEVEEPKAKGEKDFKALHKVKKTVEGE